MNLTFSYEFDSAKEPGKKERLELIDKGTSKKVNNLNRDEYCDLICCRILYGFSQSQLDRFQIGLFKILPKEFLSNTSTVTVLKTLYKQYKFCDVGTIQMLRDCNSCNTLGSLD
jgi:hypothetical protein